ncbi:Dimeric alpha-beta barrel [Niveomyces insectorum RCEF 264]|uniref:Dimeric alpha-beta barrel n=1 Tax=Niveomyces insectorum RCEF 264 TaxID=1081102 RepID=A0A167T477_9HYPO|nr:Dimeric alpha-beta barrel [Niveomyces insectorum RCEF 264]
MAAKIDWLVIIPDHEGALPKRMASRPTHLEGLAARVQSGAWTMGGATLAHPPVGDEPKAFNGSCMVAHAATKEEVLDEVRKDTYAKAGVWNLDKITIYPLMTAFRKEKAGAAW